MNIDNDIELIFKGLATRWREETGGYSLYKLRVENITYKDVIDFLQKQDPLVAISLVLREMEKNLDYWFGTLRILSKEDLIINEETFEGAMNAWLEWGRGKGYI